MINSILFVTSSNLATNPRCVKEIQLAVKEGFQVKVIACKWGGWSQGIEKFIQHTLDEKVEIRYIDVTRADKINWLVAAFIEKICFFLFKNLKSNNLRVISFALSKRSYLLLKELNRTHWKPSLVIAHNPAAFYPAYAFAKVRNTSFAVDVEDYHPGERQPLIKRNMVMHIMQKLLPKANYSSYASPLILQQCMKEMERINGDHSVVVNNVFWQHEFSSPKSTEVEPLKFIWFSQNIDYKRGLENVLTALDKFTRPFTLTLIGNVREEFFRNEIKSRNYVKLLDPLPQPELHHLLGGYDIGLAVEDVEADLNRSICLTNKIWAYFQAGLYIISTHTPAQTDFMNQFPNHGMLVGNNPDEYLKAMKSININWHQLSQLREERFKNAAGYSWDSESTKLLSIWRAMKALDT